MSANDPKLTSVSQINQARGGAPPSALLRESLLRASSLLFYAAGPCSEKQAHVPRVIDGERLLTLGKFSLSAQAEALIDNLGMNADAIENAVEEMIVT